MTGDAVPLHRLDRFVPAGLRQADPLARLRLRLSMGAALGTGCVAVPYVPLYAFGFGARYSATLLAVLATALFATPLALRLSGSPRFATQWFLGCLWTVLVGLSVLDGGTGPPIYAFPLMPVLAAAMANNRSAMFWGGAAIAAIGALVGADAAGFPFVSELDEAQNRWFGPAVGLGVVVASALPTMLYRSLADEAHIEVAVRDHENRAILAATSDAILALDAEGRILTANPSAARLFGVPVVKLVGVELQRLVDGAIPTDTAAVEVQIPATNVDAELTVAAATGRTHAVATLRDVTARNDAQRTTAEARDRALDATRAKSSFLANMSHELRTPLNAIIGYAELLVDDARNDAPGLLGDLDKITASGRHLLHLIDDILDLSKIEAGRLELRTERVDLKVLVIEAVDRARPAALAHGNVVTAVVSGDPGRASIDATRLRQILDNLLSNACKFTQDGQVTLTLTRVDDDLVRVSVRDSGIGIPGEMLERVFGEFEQGDSSTTRRYGGSGLGLTITRRLARIMGGDVTVQSAVGRGSTFTLAVPAPVARRVTPAAIRPSRGSVPPEPGLALVVEDDAQIRELFRRSLSRGGWQVVTAEDGEQALRALEGASPHVVVLDLTMPVMDGFEFLASLRDEPSWAHLPVVVVTARDLSSDERLELSTLAQRVVQKGSASREVLLEQVRQAVAEKRRIA